MIEVIVTLIRNFPHIHIDEAQVSMMVQMEFEHIFNGQEEILDVISPDL
jgi:hypothetical protein